jgi:four helix bundle protein
MELVAAVYRLVPALPSRERYGLTGQLTRAGVSVPANIAEGHGRLTRGDFARHLAIARGSVMEVETLLLVTERLGMLSREHIATALALADEISRMLSTLIAKLGKPRKR